MWLFPRQNRPHKESEMNSVPWPQDRDRNVIVPQEISGKRVRLKNEYAHVETAFLKLISQHTELSLGPAGAQMVNHHLHREWAPKRFGYSQFAPPETRKPKHPIFFTTSDESTTLVFRVMLTKSTDYMALTTSSPPMVLCASP